MDLIDSLIREGWLKTPRIIDAFRKIKRVDFLPEEMKDLAELNEALPIGYGQTISQPLVVAFMIEQLQPQLGDKILDIGSGSGWTTAILAEIVSQNGRNQKPAPHRPASSGTGAGSKIPEGPRPRFEGGAYGAGKNQKGRVVAIERIPELMEFGKKNVTKYNFIEKGIVEFICTDGSKGYPQYASRPEIAEGFDKILASASAEKLPRAWKEQLKIGGRIVTPVSTSIWLFIKKSEDVFEEVEYPGFVFVPLITK